MCLALQSELAQSIAEKVEVTVTGEEHERLTAARSVAPEVYESYPKGQFALNKSNSKAEFEESIGYFEDAIKRDPTFAPAYVGLANAYSDLGTVFIGAPPGETRAESNERARKALELDPNLAEAHVLLANVKQEAVALGRCRGRIQARAGIEPEQRRCSRRVCFVAGVPRTYGRSCGLGQRGRELDPLAVSGEDFGWILFQSRRYDEAIHELRSALAVRPDDGVLLWTWDSR